MLISPYADIEIITPTSAHIIIFLAFFVFSSSPLETRYITQPNMIARTASTATYWIHVSITLPIIPKVSVSFAHPPSQPGRFPQFIGGFAAKVGRLPRIKRDIILNNRIIILVENIGKQSHNNTSRKCYSEGNNTRHKYSFSSGEKFILTVINNHIPSPYRHHKSS